MLTRDGSIWNCNNWARIAIAFPQVQFHLELILKSWYLPSKCTRMQWRAEEARQALFFDFCSFCIRTHLELFHPCPRIRFQWFLIGKQTHMEPISNSGWNRSKQSHGNTWPICTRNVMVAIGTCSVVTQPKTLLLEFQTLFPFWA